MGMPKLAYNFGPFSIDAHSRLLFRNGERVPLPPKAADLLILLVEHRGELITKDELLKQVWPDTFVEEGSLSKHIFLLRKSLGENTDGAPYIETVPKRGYRFVGPAEAVNPSAVAITAEERTSERIVIEEMETFDTSPQQFPWKAVFALLGLTIAAGALAWTAWTSARAPAPLRSLLVLPFANLGQKAETEYFVDGLAEELIAAFSGVRGLRVIPRTTAFRFKGKSVDVRAIGRQLEVEAVLDGDVQRDGDRLRIHLSLTRVSDGQTIWSQTYQRETRDVLATQNEIAGSVIGALLGKDQRPVDVPAPSGTKNVEAQNLYLKANFIRQKFFGSSLDEALALFKTATQLDPDYAQAWAGQAFCYSEQGYGYSRYPKDVFPLALQAAQRALHLNPRLALAHAILGNLNLIYVRDWKAAERELGTAIALDPNDGESHHWMSHYWVSLGRFEEAKKESRRALECDPLNFSIGSHQAWVELENGDYPGAIRAAGPTLRLDPMHVPTSIYLMTAYEESGQFDEAIRVRRRIGWQRPPVDDLDAGVKARGAAGYWRVNVDFLEATRKVSPVGPMNLAGAYMHLGDRQHALTWIEQALEERDPWVIYLKVQPVFAGLRSDPRFQKIIKAAGIP